MKTTALDFSKKGIRFQFSPLPGLANWLYSSTFTFFLFHNPVSYLLLLRFIRQENIKYVYCRSYHAAFSVNVLKRFFRLKIKVHFDPRSLFVEEGQYLRKISGLSLKLWSFAEKINYTKSDLVTFVSKPFEELQKQKFHIQRSKVIYTSADTNQFTPSDSAPTLPLQLCYVGQLEETGWHHPDKVLDLYEALQKKISATLTIVTNSPIEPLERMIKERGLRDISLRQANSTRDVSQILSKMHFGLLCYKELRNDLEKRLAQTVVASKSGEYLAAGIPMICYRDLRGIAELIENEKLGVTYSFGNEASVVTQIKEILSNYKEVSKRCRLTAEAHFGVENNRKLIEEEIDILCAQ